MNCSDQLIGAYLDRELDLTLYVEFEHHLAICERCSETYAELRTLKNVIRSHTPYFAAPARLERAVRDALRKNSELKRWTFFRSLAWPWFAIAASILLTASITWNAAGRWHAQREIIAQTLIASHVRSLMGDHLVDVASTDQHTVKPWFGGRTDFSPEVQDLGPQGFPLVGGRLDYVDGRTVAALIYRRRQHLINVFTWPTNSPYLRESQFARNGFNVLQWSDASMTYWAVSDLDAAELNELRRLCAR